MKLSTIYSGDLGYIRPFILTEGYGRTYGFGYDRFKVDPQPNVLLLGRWRHPSTRNTLVGGINLNYLNELEIERLRKSLSDILRSSRNLKARYWTGQSLVPDIFDKAYRTYDSKFVHAITPGTLRLWSKRAEQEKLRRDKEQAAKQRDLDVRARAKMPEPEVPPEEPEVPPEAEAPPETSQERRERERREAEARAAERGTAARRPEEPEET